MPSSREKDYRKQLTFQAGEVSPLFLGRSDAEYYGRGLSEATNMTVEKRGGIFRRKGLEHFGQAVGNACRVFTKQIHLTRFDTLFITDSLLTIYAPGASFLSPNLVSNPNFIQGGTDWAVNTIPAESLVVFANATCILQPDQSLADLVLNGNFDLGAQDWLTRTNDPADSVEFLNSNCTLTPRQGGGGAGDFAGIFQAMTTGSPNALHTLNLVGSANAEVEVKIGTGEDDGTYLDTIVSGNLNTPIPFTPTLADFTLTITCLNPQVNAVIENVQILDPADSVAGVSQEVTITAPQVDDHLLQVSQVGNNIIRVKVGTAANLGDIATIDSADETVNLLFVPNAATVWVTVEGIGANVEEATILFVGVVAEADSGGNGIEMVAPWTEDQLDQIHIIEEPKGQVIYFTHPNVRPQKLVYDFALDTYSDLTDVVFTGLPPTWGFADNWPATGTFHQGRLWLGGTPEEPQTFWASQSGLPEEFTIQEGLDSSSLEFTLQKFGRIKWMLGTKALTIGAENGEHIVSSDGPNITPVDYKIEQQSSYGSNNMQGIQIGEKIMYLTPDGRRLQSMAYEWQEDNWLSQDLTFVSEHITKGIGEHRAWAQNPGGVLGITLKNGDIAVLTYDRTASTVGWTLYQFQDMKVFDIAVGHIDGVSKLVFAGQRTGGFVDVEITSAVEAYVDSFVSASFEPAGNTLTGLDHLEGKQVQVVVDGAVEPPQFVIGGSITNARAGNRITAGIQIKSKIVTLPPDEDGYNIRSWKKRWNKVWALMFESNAPIINGVRPPDRTPSTPMDTAEPASSKHFKTVNLGWDDFGLITIEEDLPVPMNILAIYGELGRETL